MWSKARLVVALTVSVLVGSSLFAAGPDPRTPAGQLAVCGGAATWNAIGYLEFNAAIVSTAGVQGPYRYRWDRHDGYLRFTGPSPTGSKIDAALDLGSRSGGAWEDGNQLTGKRLGDIMKWALQRFGEDVLWLTFPLDWGQAGVTVTPLPDTPGEDGRSYPTVEIRAPSGVWRTLLDPATGLVLRTVVTRTGGTPLTVTWGDWQKQGGVLFAQKRSIAETGETVQVQVSAAQAAPPPDAF